MIGLMRGGALDVLRRAGLDMSCLRTLLGMRVLPADERVDHPELPLGDATEQVIRAAVDGARERRSDVVTTSRLVRALIDHDDGFLRDLLFRCGARLDDLAQQIDSWPD